jgi:hypothetical protein
MARKGLGASYLKSGAVHFTKRSGTDRTNATQISTYVERTLKKKAGKTINSSATADELSTPTVAFHAGIRDDTT